MATQRIEWESLRRTHEELSRKISQIVWLRLLVLLLLVLIVRLDFPRGLLGADILNLHVGEWRLGVPMVIVLLPLSELYFHILRKKRQLIELMATERIAAGDESCSALDRLTFARSDGRAAPFVQHPGQLTKWLHLTAILALAGALVPLVVSYWADDDNALVMCVVGLVGLYATVYGRYLSEKLERQAALTIGHELPPTWVTRLWENGKEWARRQMAQLRPRFSVVTGSLLILMTLYLSMTVGSCGDPRAGYTIVTGAEKWISGDMDGVVGDVMTPVGRSIYVLSLLLAAMSAVLAIASLRRAGLIGTKRWMTILSAVSGGISLFVLADYTFFLLAPLTVIGLPWILGWLVPLGLWYAYGFRRDEAGQARWRRIRAVLVALYFPVVVFNVAQMATAASFGLYGLLTFYFGVHLVALGYLKLAAQARMETVGAEAVPVPLEQMSMKSAAM